MITKAILNTKFTKFESKIPGITTLAAKAALETKAEKAGNKTPDTTGSIITPKFNRLRKTNFDANILNETRSKKSCK